IERVSGPQDIQVMLEDSQRNLWLGSTHGLYRIAPDGTFESTSYLREKVVSLYEDREGDIWVGTSTGIVRLRQRILTTYTLEADAGRGGGPLFADERGALWYASPNLGLVRIVDGRSERILTGGDYKSLASAGPDLWLGQKDGVLLQVKLSKSA